MMRRAQPWLGTLVDIGIDDGAADEAAQQEAIAGAFEQIAQVHRLMSFHDRASDVSRFNLAEPGELLAVHPHTWQVLQLAQELALASGGIFNVACAPRLVAWACLPAPHQGAPDYVPGASVYECGEPGQVRKRRAGWIDLGGIAKGYAVDLAIAALQRAGVASACVNAGGDLRVIGAQATAVTIRAPHAPQQAAGQVLLQDEAMASSASYFSEKSWRGVTVNALIDGRDGQCVKGRASVSVRAPVCAVADALTKIVLASGDAHHPLLGRYEACALII